MFKSLLNFHQLIVDSAIIKDNTWKENLPTTLILNIPHFLVYTKEFLSNQVLTLQDLYRFPLESDDRILTVGPFNWFKLGGGDSTEQILGSNIPFKSSIQLSYGIFGGLRKQSNLLHIPKTIPIQFMCS